MMTITGVQKNGWDVDGGIGTAYWRGLRKDAYKLILANIALCAELMEGSPSVRNCLTEAIKRLVQGETDDAL